MTREELAKILEQFAVCIVSTIMSDMSVDEQHNLIISGIDKIADTVMIVTDPKRFVRPSIN